MGITMNWLESHVGSMEAGIELIKKLYWPIHFFQHDDGIWYVMSAESVILSTDSREVLDAFLYGMGLAYAGIPEDLLDYVAKALKDRGFAG